MKIKINVFFRKSLNPSEHLPAWGKESTSPTPESTNQVYLNLNTSAGTSQITDLLKPFICI